MSLALLSIGLAAPPRSITQQEAAAMATAARGAPEDSRRIEALYQRTKIRTRGSVLLEVNHGSTPQQSFFPPAAHETDRGPGTDARMRRYALEATPLALLASTRALAEAGVPGPRITHLVTVSCSGFHAPGVDVALMKGLPLSSLTSRTHVGFMGCHGALNGLRVASGLVHEPADARVLMCAVELCSVHFYYGGDPGKIIANALFADGAAALVAAPASQAPRDAWRLAASGSCVFPDSEDTMTWHIGDHGFEMTLSPRVPGLIAQHLPAWLSAWLRPHGITCSQIPSWAVHPGGPRILEAVADGLTLPSEAMDVSRDVLARHGNMSSPTILFILEQCIRRQAPRPCVAMAFGPGLSVEAALFT